MRSQWNPIKGRLVVLALIIVSYGGCSRRAPENPFTYSFIRTIHIPRQPGKPYSDYKALYLLTEDFEPVIRSRDDLQQIDDALGLASDLTSQYGVPWTHFVDVNVLAPAYIGDEPEIKNGTREVINRLACMTAAGDDCELHLHGSMDRQLLDYMRSQEKLHPKVDEIDDAEPYRLRRSFFFNSFYRQGFRDLVTGLTYGKLLLEKAVYDGKAPVLAFRPGGWDHGSSSSNAYLYFAALGASGLSANSGLATGEFGGDNFQVGGTPGNNVATVQAGGRSITEISPTSGPGGYVNPVLPCDLEKLANAKKGELAIIVSVYHLSALQRASMESAEGAAASHRSYEEQLIEARQALDRHFRRVADLRGKKMLYPVTVREALSIISEQTERPKTEPSRIDLSRK
jgi:hypothetical protein